jgi:hypothetical protein
MQRLDRPYFQVCLLVVIVGATLHAISCGGNAIPCATLDGAAPVVDAASQVVDAASQVVDAATPIGDGAGPGPNLGDAGPYFAGTTCHCETTTSATEGERFEVNGYWGVSNSLIESRTMQGNDCVMSFFDTSVATFHPDGTASFTGDSLPTTIIDVVPPTWRCEAGAFRLDYVVHTMFGDTTATRFFGPPQCPTFPCPAGTTCTAPAPPLYACIKDGSLPKNVQCGSTQNCQAGLSCTGGVCM